MKSKLIPALSVLGIVAGVCTLPAEANSDMGVSPKWARTYCKTDPLKRAVVDCASGDEMCLEGTMGSVRALVDDNQVDTGVTPGGNEVVWQVIGTLGQVPPGEAYCGYLEIPEVAIGASGVNIADRIQDCVGVVQYEIASSAFSACKLWWAGSTIGGVHLSLSVSICEPNPSEVAQGNWIDNFEDTDCIVDGLDFAGGTFVGIHDVQVQKGDNKPGVGGVCDLTFFGANPEREIELSAAAVDHINANAGGTVDLIVRCADSNGANNGFLGGTSNAVVIHDPPGVGFGVPGELRLVCE